jgi:hypothetical protein
MPRIHGFMIWYNCANREDNSRRDSWTFWIIFEQNILWIGKIRKTTLLEERKIFANVFEFCLNQPWSRGQGIKTNDPSRLIARRIVMSCFPWRLEIPADGWAMVINRALHFPPRFSAKSNASSLLKACPTHSSTKIINLHSFTDRNTSFQNIIRFCPIKGYSKINATRSAIKAMIEPGYFIVHRFDSSVSSVSGIKEYRL